MRPKSLAERLEWMAANLPGFLEELEAVDQALGRVKSFPVRVQIPSGPVDVGCPEPDKSVSS